MPCDTIQMNQVEIGSMNKLLLEAALKALGATNISVSATRAQFYLDGVGATISNGVLQVRAGYEGMADRIKVGYSRQVIGLQAKRNGWQVKEVKKNVFQVIK